MALQFKLLCKIIKSLENLWVKLVRKKYLKHDNLFNYITKVNVSWQWRKLMSLRALFRKDLRWSIGNGDDISFWYNN